MKKTLLALALGLASISSQAQDSRTIKQSFDSNDISELEIDVPVGKVDLTTYQGSTVEIDILVEPKDSDDWFGDVDLSEAVLENTTSGGTLALEIDSDDYELTWTVKAPEHLALDIEVGVGKIELQNLSNSAELEVGVGKIDIHTTTDDYNRILLDSGVGKTRMSGFSFSSEQQKSMVGSTSEYNGSGRYNLDAEVGVGKIKLQRD
ncbi:MULTISPECIES: hypothetical protein [unclassified Pseudoalteromonas]|uniref:hypothetical protein n=1 Tax=unclassified Pseudoalteromonas TaxID=194690 RepID=UPI00301534BA